MDVKLELIVLLVIQLIGGSAFSRSSNVLIKLTFPFGSKADSCKFPVFTVSIVRSESQSIFIYTYLDFFFYDHA